MKSNLIFKARSWLNYYYSSKTIHHADSPFLYSFCKEVIENRDTPDNLDEIEQIRGQLLNDTSTFQRLDFGAGPVQGKPGLHLPVNRFVQQSSISSTHGRLLYRIAQYWKPNVILELGTAAGMSGAYLKYAAPHAVFKTMEGDPALVNLARQNFNRLGIANAEIIEGKFDIALPHLLESLQSIDLVFIDGHHNRPALFHYIDLIEPYLNKSHGLLVLDDIHWNPEMEEAWESIKTRPGWPMQLDLYQFGLLIKNPDLTHQPRIALIASKWKPMGLGLFR